MHRSFGYDYHEKYSHKYLYLHYYQSLKPILRIRFEKIIYLFIHIFDTIYSAKQWINRFHWSIIIDFPIKRYPNIVCSASRPPFWLWIWLFSKMPESISAPNRTHLLGRLFQIIPETVSGVVLLTHSTFSISRSRSRYKAIIPLGICQIEGFMKWFLHINAIMQTN